LALKGLNNNTTTGYTYLYDQLNRLLTTWQHAFGTASGSFKGNWSQSNTGTTDNYAETFRYDANGNILQLNRNGNSQHPGGLAMDRLTYTYRSGTNQLWSVQDGIAAGAYAGDIDNQGGSNYSYDRIGNLIGDVSENINQVNWTVYGKIGNIRKKQAFLGYVYNAGGERVVKQYLPYATNQCADCPPGTGIDDLEVYERNSATPETYKARKSITFLSEYTDERYRDYSAIIEAGLALCTPQCNVQPPLNTSDADIYIRDATGNVLAVYHYDRKTSQLRWSEQHLYGSARLGMYLPEKSVISVSTDSKQREQGYLGKQIFELSNHLGNVLATISDKKLQVSKNTNSTAYFEADVQTVQDYYAFGMQMPGRKLSGGYRYGFNGKENDNEVKGEGNQQDYGMRIYDGRIGKFLSVDPLAHLREWLSPYNFVQNNPINRVDPTGALDDWVQDADGNIKWDKDANSQETTKAGEKYLGKTLTFTFNSYIDRKLWDGPGGSSPAGDKLTSTISLTGNENEAGELTSLSATKSVKIGETPIGAARDYFPGLGSDQNKFGFNRTTLNFEQHASVSPIEGFGLGLMGYDIVNVAQKLTLSLSGNNLSVTAATDIFPSATLAMNGSQMMYYPQPSFKGTHGYQKRTVFGDNGMGGSTTTEYTPLRPAPSFHIRFKK